MNAEQYYRAKAIRQLTEKKEMRFRENMNLYFILASIGFGSWVFYLIIK